MEFITHLTETEDTKVIRDRVGNTEFRMLKHINISNEVSLSIQASYAHYCSPRKTIDLYKYAEMEIAIFKNGGFVSVEEVTKNELIIFEFSNYYEGMVYGGVPVYLIEKLYKDLMISKFVKEIRGNV